jgi:hypothetical protein
MKKHAPTITMAALVFGLGIVVIFVWNAVAGNQTPIAPGPFPRQDGFMATLIDGDTGTVTDGDSAYVAGLAIHGFDVYTDTGTATVTLQYRMFRETKWRDLKDVTLAAGDTQSYEAWNPLLVESVRASVPTCTSCTVTVKYAGQSYR